MLATAVWLAIPGASWLQRASAWRCISDGYALSRSGDLQTSLALLTQAVATDPRHPEAHFLRGVVLGRLGRTAEAAEEL